MMPIALVLPKIQKIIGCVSLAVVTLSGCSTVYTVDDGSAVDEKLLSRIRTYGKGNQELRPAIRQSSLLKDSDCDLQWELPFSVATSYDLPKEQRIAWVRGLNVDERLSVIASTQSNLNVGDKIVEIDGYSRSNTRKMLEELAYCRDKGRPFEVKLARGSTVKVVPFEVCRGRTLIEEPDSENGADYHWLQSVHPFSVFDVQLTPDEALWAVLWTQGLSEEAGARMKTYHYGLKFVKFAATVASIASGVGAVANAASSASAAAGSAAAQAAARSAASAAATQAATQQVAQRAATEAAQKILTEQLTNAARDEISQSARNAALKLLKQQAQNMAIDSMQTAAIFKSNLSGVSWIAGTGFYMADQWALERMKKVGADPLAAFTLHYKLASSGDAANSFTFDTERLELARKIANQDGYDDLVAIVLKGDDPYGPVIQPISEPDRVEMLRIDLAAQNEVTAEQITTTSENSDPGGETSQQRLLSEQNSATQTMAHGTPPTEEDKCKNIPCQKK